MIKVQYVDSYCIRNQSTSVTWKKNVPKDVNQTQFRLLLLVWKYTTYILQQMFFSECLCFFWCLQSNPTPLTKEKNLLLLFFSSELLLHIPHTLWINIFSTKTTKLHWKMKMKSSNSKHDYCMHAFATVEAALLCTTNKQTNTNKNYLLHLGWSDRCVKLI